MVINTNPSSRRALLAAAAGGTVALVAESLARPLAALAADGDVVRVGATLTAESTTTLSNMTGPATVLLAESNLGVAIDARSRAGPAIGAISDEDIAIVAIGKQRIGVVAHGGEPDGLGGSDGGEDTCGVLGFSGAGYGVAGIVKSGEGVHAESKTGSGVYAKSTTGFGLDAASDSGIAVRAIALHPDQGARAIVAAGPVEFSSAGRGIIARGAMRATVVSPVALDAAVSKILVTLLANPAGKNASSLSHVEIRGSEAFTVVLSTPAAREVPFAYFVLG
jgi:hypothetical protein